VIFINTAGQNPGNNYIGIFKISTNLYRGSVVASGSTISITQSVATSGFIKAALAYKTGDTALFINGVQVGSTNTTAFAFNGALSAVQFIANSAIGAKPASIRSAAIYNSRLDDADLMVLTSPTYYSNVRDMIWDTFVARTSTFSELPGCLQTRHNELITL
jgi:hypothetical protein